MHLITRCSVSSFLKSVTSSSVVSTLNFTGNRSVAPFLRTPKSYTGEYQKTAVQEHVFRFEYESTMGSFMPSSTTLLHISINNESASLQIVSSPTLVSSLHPVHHYSNGGAFSINNIVKIYPMKFKPRIKIDRFFSTDLRHIKPPKHVPIKPPKPSYPKYNSIGKKPVWSHAKVREWKLLSELKNSPIPPLRGGGGVYDSSDFSSNIHFHTTLSPDGILMDQDLLSILSTLLPPIPSWNAPPGWLGGSIPMDQVEMYDPRDPTIEPWENPRIVDLNLPNLSPDKMPTLPDALRNAFNSVPPPPNNIKATPLLLFIHSGYHWFACAITCTSNNQLHALIKNSLVTKDEEKQHLNTALQHYLKKYPYSPQQITLQFHQDSSQNNTQQTEGFSCGNNAICALLCIAQNFLQ